MKHKILSLLVLLLTAATGAWAQADVTWTFAQVHDVVGDEITADETYTSDGISMKWCHTHPHWRRKALCIWKKWSMGKRCLLRRR